MHHHHVAHQHVVADDRGEAFAVVIGTVAMHDGAVLKVGPRAHANGIHVAAQNAVEPDTGLGADLDIADDHSVRCNEGIRGYARADALEGNNERTSHRLLLD